MGRFADCGIHASKPEELYCTSRSGAVTLDCCAGLYDDELALSFIKTACKKFEKLKPVIAKHSKKLCACFCPASTFVDMLFRAIVCPRTPTPARDVGTSANKGVDFGFHVIGNAISCYIQLATLGPGWRGDKDRCRMTVYWIPRPRKRALFTGPRSPWYWIDQFGHSVRHMVIALRLIFG